MARDTQSGRADIIVKRGGTPLMVVEVKDEDIALDDDDRDQAVSYARIKQVIVADETA
jgi:hypothetical protein